MLDSQATAVTSLDVAVNAKGQAVVAWTQEQVPTGSNIWTSRMGEDGGFGIATNPAGFFFFGNTVWTAIDPNGAALVVWEAANVLQGMRSNRTGDSWTTPPTKFVGAELGSEDRVSIAMNASGDGVVVWRAWIGRGLVLAVIFR